MSGLYVPGFIKESVGAEYVPGCIETGRSGSLIGMPLIRSVTKGTEAGAVTIFCEG